MEIINTKYPNGAIKTQTEFTNGEKTKCTRYYKTGEINRVINYKNNKKDGEYRSYGYGNNAHSIMFYRYDKKHGPMEIYNENGRIYLRCNFRNGKLNGYYTTYFDDGAKEFTGEYVNGVKQGLFEEFYETGQIHGRNYYYYNNLTLSNLYYENGNIKSNRMFDEYYQPKTYNYFYLSGDLKEALYFDRGMLKKWEKFYDNGVLKNKTDYLEGKKHGLCEWYHENGMVSERSNYEYDALVGDITRFDEEGNIVVLGPVKIIN
jgi:antitoxin component YwqK of YwqJK toxin-antitoxin module